MGHQFWIIYLLCFRFPITRTCQINDTNCNSTVGSSMVLPCEETPTQKISRVYWQDNNEKVLIDYNNGTLNKHQDVLYKDRVTFSANYSFGNFTIKLENLTMEDDNKSVSAFYKGSEPKKYKCKKTIFVAVPFSNPTLDLNHTTMLAKCTTQGGSPIPELTWIHTYLNTSNSETGPLERSEAGNTVISLQNGTYHVESVVNVTGSLEVTCRVTNPTSKQVLNTTFIISEENQDSRLTTGILVGILVGIVVGAFLIIGIIVFVFRKCKGKHRQSDGRLNNPSDGAREDQAEQIPLSTLNDQVTQ